ncbi:MAG: hypothetical protein AAFW66_06505, partial [Pseudomonadota bacterium]
PSEPPTKLSVSEDPYTLYNKIADISGLTLVFMVQGKWVSKWTESSQGTEIWNSAFILRFYDRRYSSAGLVVNKSLTTN